MAEAMEYALSCSICMDLYNEPVLLPCLHSLCKSCLEQLRRSSKKVQCPQCRMEFELGAKNVKKNFQLASIVDVYKGEIARRLELEKQCPQKSQQQQQQQLKPLPQQQQQPQKQKPSAGPRWNLFQQLMQRQQKKQPVSTLKQDVGRRRPPPPPPAEASIIRYPSELRPPPLPPRPLHPAQPKRDLPLSQISLNQQLDDLQIPSSSSPQIPENNHQVIDLSPDLPQTPKIPEDKDQLNNVSPDPIPLRVPSPIDEPDIPVLIVPTAPFIQFSEEENQSTIAPCVDLSGDANQVPCVTCENTPMNPATTRCSNCTMDFCGSCLAIFHPQSDTKTHDVKPLKVIQADEKCVLCENSKWTVFCMECDMLFCQACQLGHHPAELNHWIHRAKAAQRSVSMISSPTEAIPTLSRPNSIAASMATPEAKSQTNLGSACICCSKPAFVRCLDCEETLCEDCAKLKHDANTNHTFFKMDKSDSKKLEDIEKLVQMGMLKLMLLKQALMVELTSRMNTDSIDV